MTNAAAAPDVPLPAAVIPAAREAAPVRETMVLVVILVFPNLSGERFILLTVVAVPDILKIINVI